MDSRTIVIDRCRIHYRDSGGAGTPILFVHGNSFSSRVFDAQFASTLGGRYRCIALDLPGHGQSDPPLDPHEGYSLIGHASVVRALVASLGLTGFVAVGWSLGGHVLLQRIDDLPASGLVIAGTPPVGLPPDLGRVFLPLPEAGLMFGAEITPAECDLLARRFTADVSVVDERILSDILRTDPQARVLLGVNTAAAKLRDETEAIRRLQMPLMILHGEHDRLVNLDYIRQLELPPLFGGSIHVIPDAGHLLFPEQPELVNRLLEEFVIACSA